MNHNKQCVRMQSVSSEQETVTSCCEYSTGRYKSVEVGTIMIRTVIISSSVCFLVLQPPLGRGLFIHEVSRSHTTMHYSQQDSSEWVITSSQRPLPDNTQNTHNRQTSMPPVGFEPTFSSGEWPQTYALDHAAIGTGSYYQ